MPTNFDRDRSPFLVKKDSSDRVKKLSATGDRGGEIMGSIQQTKEGKSFLVAGTNVAIVSESNGQVTISSTGGGGGGGATGNNTFLTIDSEPLLTNSRQFAVNASLLLDDAGPNSTATISINDSQIATVSGTRFTNNITVVGTGTFEFGVSGSLTRLSDGKSYLVAGQDITIVSESNGQITISSTGADSSTYLVLSTTSSLTNERALTPGTGLLLTDAGAGSTATLSINDSQVATVSGTRFTGVVESIAGFSGSLTKLVDGTHILNAASGTFITTGSSAQIFLSAPCVPTEKNDWSELIVNPPQSSLNLPATFTFASTHVFVACYEVPFSATINRVAFRCTSIGTIDFAIYQFGSREAFSGSIGATRLVSSSGNSFSTNTTHTVTIADTLIQSGFMWLYIRPVSNTSLLSQLSAPSSHLGDTADGASLLAWSGRKLTEAMPTTLDLTGYDGWTTTVAWPTIRLFKV